MKFISPLIALISMFSVTNAAAEVVRVAAASNFIQPLKQLAVSYQQQSKDRLSLSFASSGKLTTQIINGAPFDLFLSADSDKPMRLEQLGLTQANSRFTYATGRLLLWTRDPQHAITGPHAIDPENIHHFAIANSKLAPYGRAAIEALGQFPNRQQLMSKLVTGENIAQTYRFVETGNAEFGLIALSQVYAEGKISRGSGWLIPAAWHQPIQQQAVLLNRAEDNHAANAFYQFLHSEQAKQIIRSFGYEVE